MEVVRHELPVHALSHALFFARNWPSRFGPSSSSRAIKKSGPVFV